MLLFPTIIKLLVGQYFTAPCSSFMFSIVFQSDFTALLNLQRKFQKIPEILTLVLPEVFSFLKFTLCYGSLIYLSTFSKHGMAN